MALLGQNCVGLQTFCAPPAYEAKPFVKRICAGGAQNVCNPTQFWPNSAKIFSPHFSCAGEPCLQRLPCRSRPGPGLSSAGLGWPGRSKVAEFWLRGSFRKIAKLQNRPCGLLTCLRRQNHFGIACASKSNQNKKNREKPKKALLRFDLLAQAKPFWYRLRKQVKRPQKKSRKAKNGLVEI